MRVVDPRRHPRYHHQDHQRHHRSSRPAPHDHQPHGQTPRKSCVIAGKRPITGRRTGDDIGRRTHRAARPFLIHNQLHRLADHICPDRAQCRRPGRHYPQPLSAPKARPPRPRPEHAQNQQATLSEPLHRPRQRGGGTEGTGQPSIHRHRRSLGDLDRLRLPQTSWGEPHHNHTTGQHCQYRDKQPSARLGPHPDSHSE